MFGRKSGFAGELVEEPSRHPIASDLPNAAPNKLKLLTGVPSRAAPSHVLADAEKPYGQVKTDEYYEIKQQVFGALIEVIDVSQLIKLDAGRARDEIRDVVNEIIVAKKVAMSASERQELLEDI